ncbi:MAG: ABC transporter permease [Haloarculaceae archaeon]
MSNKEPKRDGGVTQESIFGGSEEGERSRSSPAQRLRRSYNFYVKTPFAVAWSDWRTRIGGIGILLYILMGTVGVVITPDARLNEGDYFVPPFQNMQYPLGTDHLGRDVLSLAVHSTPAMLKMALAGLVFAVGLAIIFGMIAGYKGGLLDTIMMTVADVFIVLPGLPLIIVLSAIFTPRDAFIVGAILSIGAWPRLARELRSQVLALRNEDFVEAARAMGISTPTIVGQELVPKVAPYMLIRGAGAAVAVIRNSVALYFLGILPFSSENWGVMLNQAYQQANAVQTPSRTYLMILPLVLLSGMLFSAILFSQGLDRVFNPRLRARNSEGAREEESNEGGAGTGAI